MIVPGCREDVAEDSMDLKAFRGSLEKDAPPEGVDGSLQALWYQAKGDWDKAHKLAQGERNETGAWVHAHLHRVEGDSANAGYWYRRAGRPPSSTSLKEEWEQIAAALLAAHSK